MPEDDQNKEHGESLLALLDAKTKRDRAQLEAMGMVEPEQPEPDPEKPEFDGGAREPANEDPDPEESFNQSIVKMLEQARQSEHSA